MADTIHDPETDWCACEPGAIVRCDYRLLADAVIEELNPPDDDAAEVSVCIDAVKAVTEYVRSLPCACTPEMIEDGDACPRCQAIGQCGGKPVQR